MDVAPAARCVHSLSAIHALPLLPLVSLAADEQRLIDGPAEITARLQRLIGPVTMVTLKGSNDWRRTYALSMEDVMGGRGLLTEADTVAWTCQWVRPEPLPSLLELSSILSHDHFAKALADNDVSEDKLGLVHTTLGRFQLMTGGAASRRDTAAAIVAAALPKESTDEIDRFIGALDSIYASYFLPAITA